MAEHFSFSFDRIQATCEGKNGHPSGPAEKPNRASGAAYV